MTSTTPQTRDMLAEITALIDFVPFYGPPAVFLLGPWLIDITSLTHALDEANRLIAAY